MKQDFSSRHSSMECWNPGDMDVSGCVLANLDAGFPCRHDGDSSFLDLWASERS